MSNLMWYGNIGASFFSPVCEPPITNYSKMFIFKFVLEWSRGLEEGWIERLQNGQIGITKTHLRIELRWPKNIKGVHIIISNIILLFKIVS